MRGVRQRKGDPGPAARPTPTRARRVLGHPLTHLLLALVLLAVVLAGYAQTLIPRRWVETRLGQSSGRGGTALACLAGALMPGGPFAAFPVVLVLRQSGAALGTCVAFLTAWSVLGLHRMIIWEIPWLGWRFALLRWLISLPLPWLAAWAMHHLDLRIRQRDAD